MTNRLKRELKGMSWDIIRLVTRQHFKRGQMNAERERAFNVAQQSRRARYLQRKTAEHKAEVIRKFGTYESRLSMFNSVFAARPSVSLHYPPSNLLALSVGG